MDGSYGEASSGIQERGGELEARQREKKFLERAATAAIAARDTADKFSIEYSDSESNTFYFHQENGLLQVIVSVKARADGVGTVTAEIVGKFGKGNLPHRADSLANRKPELTIVVDEKDPRKANADLQRFFSNLRAEMNRLSMSAQQH